jgi:hypothetical protein
MYNANQSPKIAGELALHMLMYGIDRLERNEAEDKIAADILAGYLPPLTQYEVNLAYEVINDLKAQAA